MRTRYAQYHAQRAQRLLEQQERRRLAQQAAEFQRLVAPQLVAQMQAQTQALLQRLADADAAGQPPLTRH